MLATVAVILWTVMEKKTQTNRSKAWISNERVGKDLICGTLQSSHMWSVQFFLFIIVAYSPLKAACLFKGLLSKSPVCSDWSSRTGMSRCFSSASVFSQPCQARLCSCEIATLRMSWRHSFWLQAVCIFLWIQHFDTLTIFIKHLDLLYIQYIYIYIYII